MIFKPFRVAFYLILRLWKLIFHRIVLIKYKYFGRPFKQAETAKAYLRRSKEGFFEAYCKGIGLDIGYGGDLITSKSIGFDIEHGDATYIKKHINKQFDFVYSSHLLEHILETQTALRNWWKVIKPNGYLILYIPHRDLYEKKTKLPSQFNTDHKHFFLLGQEELPDTKDILKIIDTSLNNFQIEYAKVCVANYKAKGPAENSEGEYSIEIVLKKVI
jgi:SAM-dependent methyltransferase